MRLQVIRPSRLPVALNADDLLKQQLGASGFAGDVLHDLATYPPQETAHGLRQSLGKRYGSRYRKGTTFGRGYRRTGDLGRGWRLRPPARRGTTILVEVRNRIPYTVLVQGPLTGPKGGRQTADMRRRGWASITTVGRQRWLQHRAVIVRILNQKDQRLVFPRPR